LFIVADTMRMRRMVHMVIAIIVCIRFYVPSIDLPTIALCQFLPALTLKKSLRKSAVSCPTLSKERIVSKDEGSYFVAGVNVVNWSLSGITCGSSWWVAAYFSISALSI